MRRRWLVTFAIIASALVVTAAPGAVATGPTTTAVASQHTDFGTGNEATPQTLDNLSVSGSGDSAILQLSGGSPVTDTFEDNDLSEYTFSGTDTADWATTSSAINGSYSGQFNSNGNGNLETAFRNSTSGSVNISGWVAAPDYGGFKFGATAANDGYEVSFSPTQDQINIYDRSGGSKLDSASVSLTAGEPYYLEASYDPSTGELTGDLYEDPSEAPIASLSTQSADTPEGDQYGLFAFDGTSGSFRYDNIVYTVGGGKPSSAEYLSATHDVSGATQAVIDVSAATNISADLAVEYNDGSSWTTAASTTVTTAANHTLSLPEVSASEWRVRATVSATGAEPTFELGGESILFESHAPAAGQGSPNDTATNNEDVTLSAPISDTDFGTAQGDTVTVEVYVDGSLQDTQTITSNQTIQYTATDLSDGSHTWHVELADEYGGSSTSDTWTFDVNHYAPVADNSSATPADGVNITTANVTLGIDVSDRDFAVGDDTLTATFYLDGTEVSTQSVTTNGTVETTVDAALGQDHTWRVKLEDSYGNTTSSETFQFTSPAQLRIYKETAPNELIDESVNLTVRFFPFGNGDVVTRQATDGVVNLTGLPVNEQFVVTIRDNGSDRYTYRRIVIDSITEQQAVYLLNESKPNARVVFEIDDPAGQFPPEDTVLYIEKPLTRNGTTKYRTIAGDTFGASGRFPAVLQQDSRYRLRVESQDGSSERVLGFYSVYGPTVETLRIQRVEPESTASAGGIVYGGLTTFQNNTSIAVRHRDLDGAAVQEIEYRIVNGSGAVIVPNTTSTSDAYAAVYPLPANTTNVTVEYTVTFPDGLTSSGSFSVGLVGNGATDEWPINTQLLSIISWVAILATMGLLVIVNTDLAPIGGVAMATGLTILGTVAIPMPILGLSGVLAALNAFAGGAR